MNTPPATAAPPPRPRRRRSWVLVVLACVMFAFVLLALPGYAWLTSKRGAEQVSQALTQRVIQSGDTRLRVGKVLALRGPRLTVGDVRLDYRVDGVWRPAAHSSQVSVTVGGLFLWGETRLAIDADSLAVTVWQDSTGKWRTPHFGGTPRPANAGPPKPLRADVVARHGTLTFRHADAHPVWFADDLSAGLHYDNQRAGAPSARQAVFAVRGAGRGEWLRVDSLRARCPGGGRYRAEATAWVGAVRQIDVLRIAGPHLTLDASGVVATPGRADSVRVAGAIDSLAALGVLAARRLPDAGWRGDLTLVRRGEQQRVAARGGIRFEDARADSLRLNATRGARACGASTRRARGSPARRASPRSPARSTRGAGAPRCTCGGISTRRRCRKRSRVASLCRSCAPAVSMRPSTETGAGRSPPRFAPARRRSKGAVCLA